MANMAATAADADTKHDLHFYKGKGPDDEPLLGTLVRSTTLVWKDARKVASRLVVYDFIYQGMLLSFIEVLNAMLIDNPVFLAAACNKFVFTCNCNCK